MVQSNERGDFQCLSPLVAVVFFPCSVRSRSIYLCRVNLQTSRSGAYRLCMPVRCCYTQPYYRLRRIFFIHVYTYHYFFRSKKKNDSSLAYYGKMCIKPDRHLFADFCCLPCKSYRLARSSVASYFSSQTCCYQ